MAGKLLPYLQSISNDAGKLKEFNESPAVAARHAGLSAAETKALISRNPAALSSVIKAGGGIAASDDVNVTIVVVVA